MKPLVPEITRTLMPDPPPRRSCSYQYSWRLLDGDKVIARSADYFSSEDDAVAAWDEFCEVAGMAEIKDEGEHP